MDGSAFNHAFEDLGRAIVALFIISCIAVPLAIWKFVDIIIWVVSHVKVI